MKYKVGDRVIVSEFNGYTTNKYEGEIVNTTEGLSRPYYVSYTHTKTKEFAEHYIELAPLKDLDYYIEEFEKLGWDLIKEEEGLYLLENDCERLAYIQEDDIGVNGEVVISTNILKLIIDFQENFMKGKE